MAQASLTKEDLDSLKEVNNIFLGASAATVLSMFLEGKKVEIVIKEVALDTFEGVKAKYSQSFIWTELGYGGSLSGSSLFLMKKEDGAVVSNLIIGGEGKDVPEEIGEVEMDAISEIMAQIASSSSTSLSPLLRGKVEVSSQEIRLVDLAKEEALPSSFVSPELVRADFSFQIEGLISSQLLLLTPQDLALKMLSNLAGKEKAAPQPSPAPSAPAPSPEDVPAPSAVSAPSRAPSEVKIQPVQFTPLSPAEGVAKEVSNIDLVKDVPLELSVELGRARMSVREILELGVGSIVELNRLDGEPVDLLANGRLVAKGEVVVIGETFGVRVTEILSPRERVGKVRE